MDISLEAPLQRTLQESPGTLNQGQVRSEQGTREPTTSSSICTYIPFAFLSDCNLSCCKQSPYHHPQQIQIIVSCHQLPLKNMKENHFYRCEKMSSICTIWKEAFSVSPSLAMLSELLPPPPILDFTDFLQLHVFSQPFSLPSFQAHLRMCKEKRCLIKCT